MLTLQQCGQRAATRKNNRQPPHRTWNAWQKPTVLNGAGARNSARELRGSSPQRNGNIMPTSGGRLTLMLSLKPTARIYLTGGSRRSKARLGLLSTAPTRRATMIPHGGSPTGTSFTSALWRRSYVPPARCRVPGKPDRISVKPEFRYGKPKSRNNSPIARSKAAAFRQSSRLMTCGEFWFS
ncbi:MAG: hypothetical protein BWY63_00723 [Chloroflexi bacterium ADurb.Bin360]|nr:MAG: hypothetical protein BWY63_00723 [Chloroflexi bacterium ADurb.Bin360]